MQVGDIMTSPAVMIAATASITDAAKCMLLHRISGLPVTGPGGRLVGIVSEGDFLRRTELGTERRRPWWLEMLTSPGREAEEFVRSHGRKVSEVMTTNVITVDRSCPLAEAVEMLVRHRINRLPVLDHGQLVGIVTRTDLLRATLLAQPASAVGLVDDQRIRAEIQRELKKHPWGGDHAIRVAVHDGKVELQGTIFDERERAAARVLAENVAGVTEVIDRIVFIEPISGYVSLPPEDPVAGA